MMRNRMVPLLYTRVTSTFAFWTFVMCVVGLGSRAHVFRVTFTAKVQARQSFQMPAFRVLSE